VPVFRQSAGAAAASVTFHRLSGIRSLVRVVHRWERRASLRG